jgi:hypothetical protein
MSLLDTLVGIFSNEEDAEAFQADPEGFLAENGLGDITSQDITAEMPRVLESLQGNSGGATQGGAATFASSGNVTLPPPPAGGGEGGGAAEGGLSGAIESINHYTNVLNVNTQTFEDNDITTIDDADTTVDNSVNQNIEAFGDVNQDFDNDVVSGDGAVAAGDASQVNTGDGAVQAGGDITDATIATGDVQGSVTGDVSDSVVGDENQVIDDSTVGAAAFGGGDATNVAAENANLGDGTIVEGGQGDLAFNQGDGDLTQIEDSTLSESVVGGGTVQSNDVDIAAGEGSSVAFGDGSDADSGDVSVSDNYGTVQVAGDGASQAATTDNSISDSGNYTVDASDNSVDNSLDYSDNSVDASVTTDLDYSDNSVDYSDNSVETTVDSSDNSIDTYTDQSDDDGLDVDAAIDVGP